MPATANARSPIRKRKLLLRARAVLPVSRAPISNGAILIAGNRITEVGRWRDLAQAEWDETFDLGDAILLPGLINAHCHLDYTDMAAHLTPPKRFADWIKAIVALKNSWTNA